jgi:hypothetical protein
VQALSGNAAAGASLRSRIFRRLRNPAGGGGNMPKLPEEGNAQTAGQSLTDVQYARMERWAQGTFDEDWIAQQGLVFWCAGLSNSGQTRNGPSAIVAEIFCTDSQSQGTSGADCVLAKTVAPDSSRWR